MSLDTETVAEYVAETGVGPADATGTVTPLGGGVSNSVFRVDWGEDAVVVKQPLPLLDVEDHWPADVDRVHNEAAAARVYRDVIEHHDLTEVTVPAVRLEDRDDNVIIIDAAPRSARSWKSDLLNGCADPSVAADVGTFLAAVHDYAGDAPDVADAFEDVAALEEDAVGTVPRHRDAVGVHVREGLEFLAGEGPKLSPTLVEAELSDFTAKTERFEAVYETVRLTRKQIADTVTMLGFAGSLYTAQQVALRRYRQRGMLALLPWALVFLAMMLISAWIMGLPMEMRGTDFMIG